MEVYKAAAHRYPDPEHFKVNINLCWKKLDKYYSRLDETPVYYAAIALHSAYRWGYFEDVWADRLDWIQAGDQFNSINFVLAWRCVDSLLSIWPVELNHCISRLN
ncbi:hypothetical protein BFJ70_g17135 [Fusarium oxysporum]|nr:hypothetical protein BFJ71_g16789 [Fusarium oxysporum]RKL05195.1 hypothetical protein BFJ70_g17135 [Fusarium oxysporum]